jgi:hypothetical protein
MAHVGEVSFGNPCRSDINSWLNVPIYHLASAASASCEQGRIQTSMLAKRFFLSWVEKLSLRFDGPPRVWLAKYQALFSDD